jgi:Secretion system C-terminal sorting domain
VLELLINNKNNFKNNFMKKIISIIICILVIQISAKAVSSPYNTSIQFPGSSFGYYCGSNTPPTVWMNWGFNGVGLSPEPVYAFYRAVAYMPNTTTPNQIFNVSGTGASITNTFTFTCSSSNVPATPTVTFQGASSLSGPWTTLSTFSYPTFSGAVHKYLADATLNNVVSPIAGTTAPNTILRCTNGGAVNLTLTGSPSTSYTYTIEKGNFASNAFAPLGGANNTVTVPLTNGVLSSTINLLAAPFIPLRLGEWSGFVRISGTINNDCGTASFSKIYNLDGSIEYNQISPIGGCASNVVIPRYTDINYTGNTIGNFANAPCKEGWMGAYSCGISGSTSQSGYSTVNVIVDQVTNTGSIIPGKGGIVNWTGSQLPSNLQFNTVCASTFGPLWFYLNWGTLKNSALFRITLTGTNNSGNCTSISYFKIADGAGSQLWKKDNEQLWDPLEGFTNSKLNIYPNPASNSIKFFNNDLKNEKDEIKIYDLFGKLLITQKLIFGENSIELNGISPGHYLIEIGSAGNYKRANFLKY